MQDFESTDVLYVQDEVSVHRAYPFRVTARDLARFGLLYLSQGRWEGRQVIPGGWAFSARGAGGHYIVVVPRYGLVVVNRMDTDVAGPRIGADEMGALLSRIIAARID